MKKAEIIADIIWIIVLSCTFWLVVNAEDVEARTYTKIMDLSASHEYKEFPYNTKFEPDPEVCRVLTIPKKGIMKMIYKANPWPGYSGWGSAPDGKCPTYSRDFGPLSMYLNSEMVKESTVPDPLAEGQAGTRISYIRVDPGSQPAQISFTNRPSLITQYTSTYKQQAGSVSVEIYFSPDDGISGTSSGSVSTGTGSAGSQPSNQDGKQPRIPAAPECPEVVLEEGSLEDTGEFTVIAHTRGIDSKDPMGNVKLSLRVNHVYEYATRSWINGEYYDPDDGFTDGGGRYTIRVRGVPGDLYRIDAIVVGPENCPDYSAHISIEVPYQEISPVPNHKKEKCVNRVNNGLFEDTQIMKEYQTFNSGESIGGWKVTSGSIDLVESYWQASEGTQSVDLSGLEAGIIEQEIDTDPGEYYTLSFDLAGNPDSKTEKEVTVYWNGKVVGVEKSDTVGSGATRENMQWISNINYENLIASDGDTTTLAFASTNPGGSDYWGPVIDNVRICNLVGI